MKVSFYRPDPALTGLVEAYVLVDDRDGGLPFSPVTTAPMPYGVLSVNFCDRSVDSDGNRHPEIAFLGLQTAIRHWVAGNATLFAMVLLSPVGMAGMMPGLGQHTGNALRNLTDLLGPGQAAGLRAAAARLMAFGKTDLLDRWCLSALSAQTLRASMGEALIQSIGRHRTLYAAASSMDISVRGFQRRFHREFGTSPTELSNLVRLQNSMKTARRPGTGLLDERYADQSHQIRHWRRYLGTTPGRYRRFEVSAAARALECADPDGAAFYM
ncbi:AraC family transcriptional regulator [Hwanghaeella grinnelliae]|uniref:AraC family transcriptional regulator n=1 Tax=Hwanghaeella grinnelliae TaxID=2500179 RepID=A0A3S2VNW8_9PROT|nr:AraC family transcriptional regulator [Hwanghaeella grinnelliae]RVU38126.1 AraC family transcriptional regulator [Hwanghaeella grinnelliae]